MKWQVQAEDFGDGWVISVLALSYPHKLSAHLNIFTNELFYVYEAQGSYRTYQKYNNFNSAMEAFNAHV